MSRDKVWVMGKQRRDLGALLYQLGQAVIGRERPLLRGLHVEMWDYVVLSGLEHGPAPTQSQLAVAVGRDKTRLIPILDRLEARGLLRRTPDPHDRRNRVVTLTDTGRSLLADCRTSIRALEDELLSVLPPGARLAFMTTLDRLSASIDGAPPDRT